ncbi:MAG: hypothetical protein ACLVKL_00455 [Gemmiger formicilis]|uniref:hypothetical protein n=1 Tax=Gemmiger formicilis TaxID=745368 RepID=UPI003A209452
MACRWQPGMKITALLDALNSALAEPFALAWSQDSPRFLLVFTVVYAVAVIVAVTDQKNTRPGAEHGSAMWGDVFRSNKFYMDKLYGLMTTKPDEGNRSTTAVKQK